MTNYIDSSVIYYPGYSQVQVHQNYLTKTIASITNSNPCIVTTSFPHFYLPGLEVRFLIPIAFGMQQLNNFAAQIIAKTTNTFTLNLDSTRFGVFAYPNPLPNAYTPPTVIPNSSGPYLPPLPLPYGNQDSFEGTIYNNGSFGDPVNGGV
jgi:hypothetical protein